MLRCSFFCVFLGGTTLIAQQRPDVLRLPQPPPLPTVAADAPIRVVLPTKVNAADCQEHSFLVGRFGGVGDFARPHAGDHIIDIPSSHEGTAGERLKAYVWCPGYEVWTLALDSLPPPANRTITPNLTPRAVVPFRGVVRGWTAPPEPLSVQVNYWPSWNCAFFQLLDCSFGPWPMADVAMNTDGSFSVDLPDFVADRIIASHGGAGGFGFSLHETDGDTRFELKPAGVKAPPWWITPRASYPAEQAFDLEPRR